MNPRLALGWLLVLAGALMLRLPSLNQRPMHNDEAINGFKLQGLWEKGVYKYDPHEYHGPSLYYFSLPFLKARGTEFNQVDEATLRLVTVTFGVFFIALLALLGDGLGRGAVLCAAGMTALSPAMVYYSRYYIHEMLLVCFTALAIGAGWRFYRTRHLGWAAAAGAGLGLMYATKETFVLQLAAMGGAGVILYFWSRKPASGSAMTTSDSGAHAPWNLRALAIPALVAFGVAAVVGVVLFTSFFTNAGGLADSVRTYFPWLRRAGGQSPHIHPWHFYFERLLWYHPARSPVWTEAAVLVLALVGLGAAITRKGLGVAHAGLARWVALYSVLLTAIYSIISYKTPWCLLTFYHGWLLLAGVGCAVLWRLARPTAARAVLGLLLAGAGAHLGYEAVRADTKFAADRRNPYVYAHSAQNVLEMVEKVKAIAQAGPQGWSTPIKVAAPGGEYWPLPWYLRQFKTVGWFDRPPAKPDVPILLVGAGFHAGLDELSNKAWLMPGLYELRPNVYFELYVEFNLWKKYVESLPPPKDE